MTVKIRGLSGLNTLAVGEASATYTGQTDPYPVQHTRLLRNSTSIWEGFTFSLDDRGSRGYAPLERPVFQMQFRVDDVSADGNTVYVDEDGDTLRALWAIGGTGIVSRKISGEDVIIRKSTVTDGNWDQWVAEDATTGSQVSAPLHDYYKHGDHRYYFALASVEAVGGELRIGPLVEIGSVTLPDSAGNTPRTSGDLWGQRSKFAEGGALAAPTGATLTAVGDGSSVEATFTPNPSADGAVLFRVNVDPATIPTKSFIAFEDHAEPIQVGDHITIHNPITQIDPDASSARVYGLTSAFRSDINNAVDAYNRGPVTYSVHHFAEEAVSPPAGFQGNVYVQAIVPPGNQMVLRRYYRTGTYHPPFYDYYKTGEKLIWKAQVYVDKAARITINPGMNGTANAVIDLSPGWTSINESFTCLETDEDNALDRAPRDWRLYAENLDTGDLTVRVCELMPHREGEPEAGFSQIIRDSLPAGAWIRGHDLAKEGRNAISLESWTGPPFEGRSVRALYELCEEIGAKPWIHIPTTRDNGFVTGIGEHFVANWLSVFGTQRVEPGYEAWNDLLDGVEFSQVPSDLTHYPSGDLLTGGQSYGMIASRLVTNLEAVPGWPSTAEIVLGGRASFPFGAEAAEYFLEKFLLSVAFYALGWDSTRKVVSDDANGFKVSLSVAEASRVPEDAELLSQQVETLNETRSSENAVGKISYEGGFGVQKDGLNGAKISAGQTVRQEVVKHSIAGATGVLDTCLAGAEAGHKDDNLFTASVGVDFRMISARVEGNKLTPMYQIARIIHDEMGGPCNVLASEVVRDTTQSVIGSDDNPASFPTTNITALRPVSNQSRLIIIARNRSDADTVLPVLMTPFASAASAKVYPMVGDLRHHNANPPGLRRSGEPIVDGAGQTGTTLRLTSMGGNEHVGNTFTFRGGTDATVYTVTAQAQVDPTTFDLTITPALSASPDNGRATQWGDGLGWVPDETCVDIGIARDRTDLTGPLDLSSITIDDTYGAEPGGMLPGNSIVIVFDGVS